MWRKMRGRAHSINHRLDPFSSGLRPGHRLWSPFVLFSSPFYSLLFHTHACVFAWFSAISNRLISLLPRSCNSVVVQPGYQIISSRIVSTLLVSFTLTSSNASMNPWPREIYGDAIWGSWQIWCGYTNKGSDVERNEIKTKSILFNQSFWVLIWFGKWNYTCGCYPFLNIPSSFLGNDGFLLFN